MFLILFCSTMMGMAFIAGHKNKPRIAIAGLAIESGVFMRNMFLLDKNMKAHTGTVLIISKAG
ncbi:hypothetical protein SAMN05428988_4458 [Chitinophaga sp. YR573]|uniref:hypothetical protein n=1 Tax=Chitinophaga sp. YR573 TaxID=1881040 RepID=UPI0008D177FD|nr:hypothetical protein [Chitinophaga sp. YR573]SEW36182.1 hypothetical protein SAMN05428988_4458 [Chitinophaga sp. YR573]